MNKLVIATLAIFFALGVAAGPVSAEGGAGDNSGSSSSSDRGGESAFTHADDMVSSGVPAGFVSTPFVRDGR